MRDRPPAFLFLDACAFAREFAFAVLAVRTGLVFVALTVLGFAVLTAPAGLAYSARTVLVDLG